MIYAKAVGAAVILLVVLAAYSQGRSIERVGWEMRWAQRDAAENASAAAAQIEARKVEQRRQLAADEEGEDARKKLEAVAGRAAAAESAAVGLRGEVARLRAGRTATCGAIAAEQRQAGASAGLVLGGLLEEADRVAGVLATALERSRIAGLACEAVVDGMRRTN